VRPAAPGDRRGRRAELRGDSVAAERVDSEPDVTNDSSAAADPQGDLARHAGRYLTFHLGDEQFGVPILHVREIIGRLPVTPVPGAPAHVRGVINLRGKIIPVTELRQRLGLRTAGPCDRGCVIVAEAARGGRTIEMGLLVDAVSEVLAIAADELRPAPRLAEGGGTSFILAMAKSSDDGVRILLDVGRVIDHAGRASAA
jgi:purine-binding chemotaxis protein CheW